MNLLALILAANVASGTPTFSVAAELDPAAAYDREARAAWRDEAKIWTQVVGRAPRAPATIALRSDPSLGRNQSGRSQMGSIALRAPRGQPLDGRALLALRHEMAHQLLFSACPASAQDKLFHEAFALAVSGELEAWTTDDYASMASALSALKRGVDLDSRAGRAALARVISNAPSHGPLSDPLAGLVRRCSDGMAWRPLQPGELGGPAPAKGDAWVVVSRHSGEVLAAEGDARVPLPFGSTLKPFLLAGAGGKGPSLKPRPGVAEWACDSDPAQPMESAEALLRSCNGYFLDWARQDPAVVRLGPYGAVLLALGLERLPADASEAIGLRPTLTMTPIGIAQAYRALLEASPEVAEILRANSARGTLSGLDASPRLAGLALKTGTVRDESSRPDLGWIVACDADRVMVMVRSGRMPRSFAAELADRVERYHHRAQDEAAEVQVLGLISPEAVEARCRGVGVAAEKGGPVVLAPGFRSLQDLAISGAALCLGAPWEVRFPGLKEEERPYAGIFRTSPPPPLRVSGPGVSEGNRRAREGSRFIFRTRMAAYAAGVLQAEDAQLGGEPRAAVLAAVVSNVLHSRHAPRPVCDTTHCQAFKGTMHPSPGDGEAIDDLDLSPARGWLPFSQGGDAPWSEVRSSAEVARILGAPAVDIDFGGGQVQFSVRRTEGEAVYDDRGALPCEALRGPLKLPSCPRSAQVSVGQVRFRGVGRGHGEGLQLEALKRSGQLRDEMVQGVY